VESAPFGHYPGPIATFGSKYQPKYAVFFRNSRPMDFGIGYRWRSHESNLLLAVKTLADAVPETSGQPPPNVLKSEGSTSQSVAPIHHFGARHAPVHHSAARQRREPASQVLTWPWLDWFSRR
jgi:hypothetical protein